MTKSQEEKIYFIYTRVSKVWEYDMSLEDQKNILLGMADNNWHKTIIVEEMASGKKENRIEFDKMIRILIEDSKLKKENRKYWWVYVFKLDRFARNSVDFTRWEKLLNEWYKILSATETLENTPTWRLLFRMLSSFAIFESEKLSNRQSLSRIQNLIRWNIWGLWWKLIFWYTKNYNTQKIEIDKNHALVINRIFDIYLKISNQENEEYVKNEDKKWDIIWQKLNEKEKKIIRSHKSDNLNKNDNYDTPLNNELRLIREVLENNYDNKYSFKYNWKFTNELNINDELIVNYIANIWEKQDDDFDINWLNEVWWTITFSFYFSDLQIIDDYKFKLAKKQKRTYKKEEKIIWKYSNLLYMINEDGEIIELEAYLKKWSIQYRTKKRSTKDEKWIFISQLKIDKLLEKNKTLKQIVFNDAQIDFLKKLTLEKIQKFYKKNEKSLKANKMVYERIVNNYEYALKNINYKNDELKTINKEMSYYNDYLKDINDKLYNLNSHVNNQIQIFLSIFKNINETLKDTDININKKLKVLVDGIELDKDEKNQVFIKNIKISLFIKEILWMKEKNT